MNQKIILIVNDHASNTEVYLFHQIGINPASAVDLTNDRTLGEFLTERIAEIDLGDLAELSTDDATDLRKLAHEGNAHEFFIRAQTILTETTGLDPWDTYFGSHAVSIHDLPHPDRTVQKKV